MAFGCTNKDCKGLSIYFPGISFLNKRRFDKRKFNWQNLPKLWSSVLNFDIIMSSLIIMRKFLYISFIMIWYTIDLHLTFEKLSLMNLIFCLFPTWCLLLVQPAKIKVQTRKNIKFIKLDISYSIFEKSSADILCLDQEKCAYYLKCVLVIFFLYDQKHHKTYWMFFCSTSNI